MTEKGICFASIRASMPHAADAVQANVAHTDGAGRCWRD